MQTNEHRLPRWLTPLSMIALVGVVYLVTLAFVETRGLWIIDNQIKHAQLENIVASDYQDYSLNWAGREVDPGFEFQPLIFPFFSVQDNRLYAAYSPAFPTLTGPFFRLFGHNGLYVLPVIGALLTLFGVARLAGTTGLGNGGQSLAVLLVGLAGPVWFYSATYWEHTLALGACVWGVDHVLRFLSGGCWRRLVAGCAILVAGVYLRDELYVFCGAVALLVFYFSPGRRLRVAATVAATMALAVLPLWLFHWRAIGQPFGFHLGVHALDFAGASAHFADRGEVCYRLFVRCGTSVAASLVLLGPYLLAFVAYPRVSDRTFTRLVPLFGLLATIGFVFVMKGYFAERGPIFHMLRANSLFAVSPVLALAFLRPTTAPSGRFAFSPPGFLWLLGLLYVLVYGLISPLDATEGIHWGNRLLFVLYPLLAILAAANLARWWSHDGPRPSWGAYVLGLTIAVSIAAQLFSVTLLHRKKDFNHRLNHFLQSRTETAIVTDSWWVAMELWSVFDERPILRVESQDELGRAIERLRAAGHQRGLYATRPKSVGAGQNAVLIDDGGLKFFSVAFLPFGPTVSR